MLSHPLLPRNLPPLSLSDASKPNVGHGTSISTTHGKASYRQITESRVESIFDQRFYRNHLDALNCIRTRLWLSTCPRVPCQSLDGKRDVNHVLIPIDPIADVQEPVYVNDQPRFFFYFAGETRP